MPIVQLPSIGDDPTIEDVVNAFERLRKELTWLLDKNVDTKNAREFAGWLIRPDKIVSKDGDVGMATTDTADDDVRFFAGPNGDIWFYYVTKSGKLYATDAFITGRIEGSVIVGSEIMTDEEGEHPRAVMSSLDKLFKAETSATEYISIEADTAGHSAIRLHNSSIDAFLRILSGVLVLQTTFGNAEIQINSGKDLKLNAETGYRVIFESWSKIYNGSETLQQALDSKQSEITSGDVIVIDGVALLNDNINTTLLADGSVSNTEFQYINSLTSNAQTQLDAKPDAVIKQGSATTGSETSTGTGFYYASANISYTGFSSAPKVFAVNRANVLAWVSAITPISDTDATIYLTSTQSGNVATKNIDWTAILA